MAVVTWEETTKIGCRVVTAATDPVHPSRHYSHSDATGQPHNRDFPWSLGQALLEEAQAYVSAAAPLSILVPHPWGARKRGEGRPQRKTNAAYLEIKSQSCRNGEL